MTDDLNRRASDASRWSRFKRRAASFLRENWYRDIWLLGLTLLLALTLNAQANESQERKDQTCTVFERLHESAVRQLTGTYDYLTGLRPKDYQQPLNRAVLANLPATERAALITREPPYCNEEGVGLDEPGPKLPERPNAIPTLRALTK